MFIVVLLQGQARLCEVFEKGCWAQEDPEFCQNSVCSGRLEDLNLPSDFTIKDLNVVSSQPKTLTYLVSFEDLNLSSYFIIKDFNLPSDFTVKKLSLVTSQLRTLTYLVSFLWVFE